MPVTLQSLGIDKLPREERIALAEAIWESVAAEPPPPLSEARKAELRRRAEEVDADPDGGVPWEVVKAELLAELRQP